MARKLNEAHAHLLAASESMASHDRERAFWLGLTAVHTVWSMPTDPGKLITTVDHLASLAPAGSPLDSVAWLARWAALAAVGTDRGGYPDLDPLILRAADVARERGPEALAEVMSFAVMVNRDETSSKIAAELIKGARERGAVAVLPAALAPTQLEPGVSRAVSGCADHRDQAVTLSRDTGRQLWAAYANSALAYLAGPGRSGPVPRSGRHRDGSAGRRARDRHPGSRGARALLGLGRISEAYERLADVQRGAVRHLSAVQRSVPDFVEAAVRIGRADEAGEALRRCDAWAAVMDERWTDALVLRCRALLATAASAEHLYLAALAAHPAKERPFDRARTTLLYGEWLRRARRKAEARQQLIIARRLFDAMDARPWTIGPPVSWPRSTDQAGNVRRRRLTGG